MPNTLSLTRSYGSFFWGCTKFAVSPYTATFKGIARSGGDDGLENVAAAAVVCGILTFVVPVLPVLTSISGTFAAIAALLAITSMLVTYPVAIVLDACTASDEGNQCSFSANY